MKILALLFKILAVLGAVVYGPLAFVYPMVPFYSGEPEMFQASLFLFWWIAAYAMLTLVPNRYLHRTLDMRKAYILLSFVATITGAWAIGERLVTDSYGSGITPGKIGFLIMNFALLCCGWISFLCYAYSREKTA